MNTEYLTICLMDEPLQLEPATHSAIARLLMENTFECSYRDRANCAARIYRDKNMQNYMYVPRGTISVVWHAEMFTREVRATVEADVFWKAVTELDEANYQYIIAESRAVSAGDDLLIARKLLKGE